MKKKLLGIMLFGSILFVQTSCRTASSTSSSTGFLKNAGQSGISSGVTRSLTAIISNSLAVKRTDLIGVWKYQAPDCRFESENLLKQAGGEVVALQVEEKMSEAFSKVGITAGSCQFTFEEDGACRIMMGGKTIGGTYSFVESTRELTLSGAFGLLSMTGVVCKNGKNLSVLFDSQRLLSLLALAGSLSNNEAVKGISTLLGSYEGMKVGFEMKK